MIKAKINATGEVVEVRPYQTEKSDFMVCRNGGIMGELYMRSELTIIGDNELDFVSLVKKMREARHKYSALSREFCSKGMKPRQSQEWQDARKLTKRLESEVDEYLKKMESIDQRKALEAENTEFDYGHNVPYYIEKLWKN